MISAAPVRKKRGRPPKNPDLVERVLRDNRPRLDMEKALEELVKIFQSVPAKNRPQLHYTYNLVMKQLLK